MSKAIMPPIELVAKALEISVEQLSEDSAYGETPNWDSLRHLAIINEIELCYQIKIPDSEIENYFTMKAIIELYESINM